MRLKESKRKMWVKGLTIKKHIKTLLKAFGAEIRTKNLWLDKSLRYRLKKDFWQINRLKLHFNLINELRRSYAHWNIVILIQSQSHWVCLSVLQFTFTAFLGQFFTPELELVFCRLEVLSLFQVNVFFQDEGFETSAFAPFWFPCRYCRIRFSLLQSIPQLNQLFC